MTIRSLFLFFVQVVTNCRLADIVFECPTGYFCAHLACRPSFHVARLKAGVQECGSVKCLFWCCVLWFCARRVSCPVSAVALGLHSVLDICCGAFVLHETAFFAIIRRKSRTGEGVQGDTGVLFPQRFVSITRHDVVERNSY